MQKYEYLTYIPKLVGLINKTVDPKQLTESMQDLGQMGWELVSVTTLSGNTGFSWGAATAGMVMIFKRPTTNELKLGGMKFSSLDEF